MFTCIKGRLQTARGSCFSVTTKDATLDATISIIYHFQNISQIDLRLKENFETRCVKVSHHIIEPFIYKVFFHDNIFHSLYLLFELVFFAAAQGIIPYALLRIC